MNRQVNHVAQDRQTAPIEDGVANRSVLTGRNRAMLRLEVVIDRGVTPRESCGAGTESFVK